MLDPNVLYSAQQALKVQKRVFFTGSTAINRGQALCYVRGTTTLGALTTSQPDRDWEVALPSTSNNLWFAGVADQSYSAVTGGQNILINEAGSICDILIGDVTTGASTQFGFGLDSGSQGWFIRTPLCGGRGSALLLQSVAQLADTTTSPGVISASYDGSATVSSATITKASANTVNAASGDKVFVFGGAANVIGVYTVASSTATTIVLTAAPGGAAAIAYACVRAAPTALAYLNPGTNGSGQSGGIAHLTAISGGGAVTTGTGLTSAVTSMLGGTYYAVGSVTIATAASTIQMPAGTTPGQRFGVQLSGTYTTFGLGFVVTNLITAPTGAQPTSLNMLLTNSFAVFEWSGTRWMYIGGLNVLV